jgi:membrane fusion protein (multidrug efflux system)
MQEQIQMARNDVAYFSTEFNRQQKLFNDHVASASTLDGARRNLHNAQQKLASLNEQLAAIAANLDDDPTGAVEQKPRYLDGVSQRDEAARQVRDTVVRAPFGRIVTSVPSIAPGKYLPASTTAFFLVATDHVWISTNPKEAELTYVHLGQPVAVTVDTYPDARWHGVVESISRRHLRSFRYCQRKTPQYA